MGAERFVVDAEEPTLRDRDLDGMHVVDEPGGGEVAHDGGAAADPDVQAIGAFNRPLTDAGLRQRISSSNRRADIRR